MQNHLSKLRFCLFYIELLCKIGRPIVGLEETKRQIVLFSLLVFAVFALVFSLIFHCEKTTF